MTALRLAPLHHPAAAEHLEAVRAGAGDDLDRDRGDGPGVLLQGLPLYPLSAHMSRSVENASNSLMSRSFAPALSLMFAAVTTRASSQPSVSTAICRPRPVTILPPW
jgi:hypothetical protein